MTAPAGWYPDPSGLAGQRYFDGEVWTQHFTPTPPVVSTSATAVAVAIGGGGGGSMHALHAILTLLTCGMWLPVWLIFAIIDAFNNKSPTVAVGGAGAPAAPVYEPPRPYGPPAQAPQIVGGGCTGMPRQPSTSMSPGKIVAIVLGAIGGVFFGLILLGLIIEHPWLLALAIPAAGAGAVAFWRYRMAKLKVLDEYRRDVVAHRADDENKLFHEGDPRGTHGRYPPPSEEVSK
jgi:Protein of unknown function (DUF2510)